MTRIEVLPEDVMEPVGPHLDHHEVVPRLVLHQPTRDFEPPLGHSEHLIQDELQPLLTEVRDVEDVVTRPAELLGDLDLELLGERESFRAGRGEEASDPPAGESLGGGKLGGTPINNERMPFSASLSHTAARGWSRRSRSRGRRTCGLCGCGSRRDRAGRVSPVIAQAHAGTVICGVILARSPCMPPSISLRMLGISSMRSRNRSCGVPQSSPITATLGPCCMPNVLCGSGVSRRRRA